MMRRKVRVATLAATPMYYHAPLYRALAQHPAIDFTAIFASTEGLRPHDPGYARPVVWDVDSTDGYRKIFVRRSSRNAITGGTLSLRDSDVPAIIAQGRFDFLWLHGYNFLTH